MVGFLEGLVGCADGAFITRDVFVANLKDQRGMGIFSVFVTGGNLLRAYFVVGCVSRVVGGAALAARGWVGIAWTCVGIGRGDFVAAGNWAYYGEYAHYDFACAAFT